jgi:NADH-quinone oxidoreductase subunit F
MEDVDTMNSVAAQMVGKCICALGDFAANPVVATIKHFKADYELIAAGDISPASVEEAPVTGD